MDSPKISVIIPFFNRRKFLQETIESVFAQTYKDWELLLVDDGSADGSEKIAIDYAKLFPEKVHYLFHEGHQNLGASATRNLGFKNSSGDIILFLDSDDILLPQKFESHVIILQEHSEADALFGETQFWYSWTNHPKDKFRDYIWHVWKDVGILPNKLIDPPGLLNYLIINSVMPITSSLLLKRDIVDRVGGWEDNYHYSFNDQVFFVKLFLKASVYIASGCFELYRIHEDSMTSVVHNTGRYIRDRIFFLNWVNNYLSNHGHQDPQIQRYLNDELKPYRSPIFSEQVELPVPIGEAYFGNLQRVTPLSRNWGFDRVIPSGTPGERESWVAITDYGMEFDGDKTEVPGKPIDRYYIEKFLYQHRTDIQGRVLEIGNANYTHEFGGDRVLCAEVLDIDFRNNPTYLADLGDEAFEISCEMFDCFILTQTLLFIYNIRSAVNNAYTVLKPGGVLLVTLPGISKIDRLWSDYWRFTETSARRLFGEMFGDENITVETYGNVLAASAFLYGLASHEVSNEELDYKDPDYQIIIAVRAVKQTGKYIRPLNAEEYISQLKAVIREKENALNNIHNSYGWKALLKCYQIRDKIIPPDSKLRRAINDFLNNTKLRLKNT